MKTIITYQELSTLLDGKLKFKRVSDKEVKISGEIKTILFSKDISMTLKIERVGYSSLDLSTSSPALVSTALMFLPKDFKEAVKKQADGKIKIDLRAIPELSEIVKKLKMEDISFGEDEVTITISPR